MVGIARIKVYRKPDAGFAASRLSILQGTGRIFRNLISTNQPGRFCPDNMHNTPRQPDILM